MATDESKVRVPAKEEGWSQTKLLFHNSAGFQFRSVVQFFLPVSRRFRILRLFRFSGDLPKAGRRHDEFNSDLRLTHKSRAYAGDAAQQFLPDVGVFDANDLVHFYRSRQQDQRAVVVHDDGFRVLREGLLPRVAQPHDNGNSQKDTLAAPAILRPQIGWWNDGHIQN